jgi:hypothetical protein
MDIERIVAQNEKLQSHFNDHIFKLELKIYQVVLLAPFYHAETVTR